MLDKRKLAYTCRRDSELTARLIDNLLIPLAEDKERLDSLFLKRLDDEYGHLLEELEPEWIYALVQQYIAYKLFGLHRHVKKYLNEPQLARRSAREKGFLESRLFNLWHFAFARVKEDLGNDFFVMRNVLTKEEFLLYSPGVGKYESDGEHSLYFILLTFNGECYQTYGPIMPYSGLQPLDLLYFAGQLDEKINEYSEVHQKIQEDPVPFMLLMVASTFPLTFHKKDLVVFGLSEVNVASLDLKRWEDSFKIEEQDGVYELNLKRWWSHPHFAHCHYAPHDGKFIVSAATERGWEKLVQVINDLGIELDLQPDACATAAGAIGTERVLGKNGVRSPYGEMFVPEISEEEEAELERINYFLSLLMPYLNSGEEYDLRELADRAGIAYDEAHMVAEQIKERFGKMF